MIVRTVFQPMEDLEVTEEDAEVLRLNGLLHTPADPAPLEGVPGPEPADLPPGQAVAKPGPAKPDPPAATSAPTDQAPTTQKG